jgi:hypothetical protein
MMRRLAFVAAVWLGSTLAAASPFRTLELPKSPPAAASSSSP